MSKLFVSYRRKSWGFTHRLADELRERLDAEVFVDVDSIDQTDFEKAIVNHLRQSDVVLLVVSETTFIDRIHRDDDWVRREIREALALGLPLVMVCVEGLLPPSGLPDDIKDIARMQGVNFYPEYFPSAVERLTDFVTRVSSVKRKGKVITLRSEVHSTSSISTPDLTISDRASLDEALDLLDKGDFSKAIFLLEGLRESGFKSRFVNINDLMQEAQSHQQETERRRTAQIEYEEIASLVKRPITRDRGRVALQHWRQEYSDLVRELDVYKFNREDPRLLAFRSFKNAIWRDFMPKPFKWILIQAGNVTLITEKGWALNYIPEGTSQTLRIPSFEIAKYPITNAQFKVFVDAGSYENKKLWSSEGWELCREEGWHQPRYWDDDKLNATNHPVVGISWYEAIAYCQWLSEVIGESITLPNEMQWQRAAQGDTERFYPWGNDFDKNRCNFDGKTTTPVTKFEGKGDSPFGVVDMSGNVWEWCLTEYETGNTTLNGTNDRVLRGGSWNDHAETVLRVNYRNRVQPNHFFTHWGFRIVRHHSDL